MRAIPLLLSVGLFACRGASPVPPPDWSGEPAESALVWNGARHVWGYNHRLNRLGNWVGPMTCDEGGCEVEVAHSAASGLGSDTAAWEGWSTLVHAPGVGFLAGSSEFRIDDAEAEGRRLRLVEIVSVPAEGLLAGRDDYQAVLAGYDLFALQDADMYQSAALEVGPVRYDAETDALRFAVRLDLQVDCDVVECDGTWDVGAKVRQDVHYGAHVMWLLVASDVDQVRTTCADHATEYGWADADGGGAEVHADDVALSGALRGPLRADAADWPAATLALRRVSLALDAPSHLVEFATALREVDYDPAIGEARYTLDLFFKQWNAATARRMTSYATPGLASADATVCLLQLREGTSRPIHTGGEVTWIADGAPATSDAAVDRARLVLP